MDIVYDLDFERYVSRLVEQNHPEAINARLAQNFYPDIGLFVDSEKGYRYCSKSVTKIVEHAFIMTDSKGWVYALPYLEVVGIPVHSVPSMLCIGLTVESGFGVAPEEGWRVLIEDLPREVRLEIADYLDRHPPIMW